MDLLQLPDECIQFIVNLLPVSSYKQYVLVPNLRTSDIQNNYLNSQTVIVSKPDIYPLYIKENGAKMYDPLMVGRLCMVSKKFYEEFRKNKYWKPLFDRDNRKLNKLELSFFEEPPPEIPIWYHNYRNHVIKYYYKKHFKKKYIKYIIDGLKKLITIANHNKKVVISNYKIIEEELKKIQDKLQSIQYMSDCGYNGYIKNRPHNEWKDQFDGLEFDSHFNGGRIYHYENQIQSLTELEDYLRRITT